VPTVLKLPPVMAPVAVTVPAVLKLPPEMAPVAATVPAVLKLPPETAPTAVYVPDGFTAVPFRVIVAADPVAPDTK
jgi:hypothetical protein